MVDIRVLPELITNQIAAGEVVERPVSVVKELMENALDAHATHIRVEVDRGGRDLIRVSDDGDGMSRDNALLCIERYATSKIATADDLFSIATLGFRGEALPSIASVSKMTIITREKDADYGTRLFLSGGKLMEVSEIGAPPGTVVEIRNLYFNTPVRRKFLKTVNTEMGHIADAFSAMAMGAVGVGFSLIHNGRSVKDINADQSLSSRVGLVLGTDAAMKLHPLDLRQDDLWVKGYIADPSHTRAGSQRIRLFVNGRMVTDRGIVSALLQGFRGRIMKGRFPMAVVFLTLPFDGVDVNVHPSKLQVRFVNERGVYDAVRLAVEEALVLGEQKTGTLCMDISPGQPSEFMESAEESPPAEIPSSPPPSPSTFRDDIEPGAVKKEGKMKTSTKGREDFSSLFQWGKQDKKGKQCISSALAGHSFAPDSCSLSSESDTSKSNERSADLKAESSAAFDNNSEDGVGSIEKRSRRTLTGNQNVSDKENSYQVLNPNVDNGGFFLYEKVGASNVALTRENVCDIHVVGQVLGTYIILEAGDDVIIIDQHAAHERIVYEQLKRRSSTFRPPSQHLAVPEVLELNFSQSALLEKMIPALRELGFDLEPFGGTTVVLKSVPALIDHCNVRELIHDMVDVIMESGLESGDDGSHGEAWLDECLILMACHNSVRANQTMTPREMEELLRQLDECENAFHCPHGRPIRVVWSQRDFERMFKRII